MGFNSGFKGLTCKAHYKIHDSVEITNKMQPCNRIYYSTIHWRLNMFRAAYHSSSGALTVFATSDLHTYVVTGHSQVWVPTQTWLRPVTTCVCKHVCLNPSAVCALHLRTLITQVLFSAPEATVHYLLQQNPWNFTQNFKSCCIISTIYPI